MSRNAKLRLSMLNELNSDDVGKSQAPIAFVIKDARRALSEGRYRAAAEHFSGTISHKNVGELSTRELGSVYVDRSSAYTALKQYSEALLDAREAIRLSPGEASGYLRCAAIKATLEQFSDAVKVCKYGMRKLPVQSNALSSLEGAANQYRRLAKARVRFEKPHDPLNTFAPEVIDLILSFVPYQTLVRSLRVSKTWNLTLRNNCILRNICHISCKKRAISTLELSTAFRRLSNKPSAIVLDELNDSNYKRLLTQFEIPGKIWNRVEYFDLSHGINGNDIKFAKFENLRALTLRCTSHLASCVSGIGTLQYLQRLELTCPVVGLLAIWKDCPPKWALSIKVLVLLRPASPFEVSEYEPQTIEPIEVFSTFENLEHLETLNLSLGYAPAFHQLKLLQNLSIQDLRTSMTTMGDLPPSLVYFSKCSEEQIRWSPVSISKDEASKHDRLAGLTLSGPYAFRNLCTLLAHTRATQLTSISLLRFIAEYNYSNSIEMLSSEYREHLASLSSVKHLVLHDNELRDDHALFLPGIFPNLDVLDLQSCQITARFISKWIDGSEGNLQSLVLRQCTAVRNDVVPWCAARNIRLRIFHDMASPQAYPIYNRAKLLASNMKYRFQGQLRD